MTTKTVRTVQPAKDWKPESWTDKPAAQQVRYPDSAALSDSLLQLSKLPPLVTSWEVNALKQDLAEAAAGHRFLLQGGDCAETFAACEPGIISNRLKVLLQMSLVLVHGLKVPVVRVGRFAGQYAKPRSSDDETRDGVTLPSYRGDLVNDIDFTESSRVPDPRRLLKAHARSAMTMNFVRGLIDGGFADLHHPEYWDLSWADQSPQAAQYQQLVGSVQEAIRFMEILGNQRVGALSRVDFYTSHEALHLPYEQAQTRQVPRQWGWYNLSTHLPWIGKRTAELDGAHVEYFRGLRNPIGIKVGPEMTPDWLNGLLDTLNPDDEPGRITLIHRLGYDKIEQYLPALIDTVQQSGKTVLWCCDPMHGNTETTRFGHKTRQFDNIRKEVELSFDIHGDHESRLGGIHLELTGENVTECTGGARKLTDEDLKQAYLTTVDPRLNHEQALELAMLIVAKRQSVMPIELSS